jgi:two-component system NtrC family sensor kinase
MRLRLGLRAQILLALTLVFLISFALLGSASVQLIQRASMLEAERSGHLLASAGQALVPLTNLLLFYVALTGVAVLLLAYVALTRLIVQPMETLTQSSERLAGGAGDVRVDEAGAAEVYRLAVAFNAMATQLRAERRALEQRLNELEEASAELRRTQQDLVHGEKLASVGRLAAGVAHEIGNPLAAILGMLELIRGGDLSPTEQAEFLERIQRETQRINGIIRDLLAFSRRDETEQPGHSADPRRAIEDAVSLVRPQRGARGVTFDVQVAPDVGRVALAEPRLAQVLLNLLLNALDALDGRGTLQLRAEPGPADRVRISVRDDGPGIDPAIMGRLFEPFATTKAVGKGTGLGLAVCHSLVESAGGTIRASNLEGRGALFEVELPRAPRLSARPPPPSA